MVGLHVNLLVGVVLGVVDLLHSSSLLNVDSVHVDTVLVLGLVHVTDLENVLQTVKSNLDNLVVHAAEEVAKWLDASLVDEVADLLWLLETTGGGVGDGPASLLSGLEVAVLEEVDEWWDDVGIDDRLDLVGVSGGDVGDGPASLLADSVLGRAQQAEESSQSSAVDDDLGLDIITGNNVSDGTKSWSLNRCGGVHEQIDETAWDTGLNDGLDLIVWSIGEVRDGPASINQDFVVKRIDETGEDRQCGQDLETRD